MAWRFVVQPNHLYARFSTVVYDFTHYNLDEGEAVLLAQGEYHLSYNVALTKVVEARLAGRARWDEALALMDMVYGEGAGEDRLREIGLASST